VDQVLGQRQAQRSFELLPHRVGRECHPHQHQCQRREGLPQQLKRLVHHRRQRQAGLRERQPAQDGQRHRMDHRILHRQTDSGGHVTAACLAARQGFARRGELQDDRGHCQQHQRMQGHQRKVGDERSVTVGQRHQRRADHHGVGERAGQRQHRAPGVEPQHCQHPCIQHHGRTEIHHHGAELQRMRLRSHGPEQQRRREQQEHHVGQVAHRAGPDPRPLASQKPDGDQQYDRDQRCDDGVIHRADDTCASHLQKAACRPTRKLRPGKGALPGVVWVRMDDAL
jgi:hypothetical protein